MQPPERPPAGSSPRVGAVVLNHCSTEDTLAAIASLRASDALDLRITVVDNAAEADVDPTLATRLPSTVEYLVSGGNLGFAAGNNLAIDRYLEAGAEHILILNPDARVEPTTLSRLLLASRQSPTAGFVGPRLLYGNLPGRIIQSDGCRIEWQRGAGPTHLNVDVPADLVAQERVAVDYVTGACVLISRRALDDVGLIGEEWFLYFEESDLAVRAARRGWTSLVDRSAVAWHHRRSTGDVPTRAYLYYLTRNRGLFAARHLTGPDPIGRAYADFDRRFVNPWRKKLARTEPRLIPLYDAIVALAKQDAVQGRFGERGDLSNYELEGVPGWGH